MQSILVKNCIRFFRKFLPFTKNSTPFIMNHFELFEENYALLSQNIKVAKLTQHCDDNIAKINKTLKKFVHFILVKHNLHMFFLLPFTLCKIHSTLFKAHHLEIIQRTTFLPQYYENCQNYLVL